jgi:hypothetical protein
MGKQSTCDVCGNCMGRGNSPFWYEYGNTGRPGFGKASTHVPLRELALEQKPKHGNRQGVDCEVPDGLAEVGGVFPACDGEGKPGKDDYQPDKRPNAQPSKRVELEKPKRFLRLRFSVFVNEKCQSSVSRCMENSHQLRDKTVCVGFGKRATRTGSQSKCLTGTLSRNPPSLRTGASP